MASPKMAVVVAGPICLALFLLWSALYALLWIPLKVLRTRDLAALPSSLDSTQPPPMTFLMALVLMLEAPLALLSFAMYGVFKPFWLSLAFLKSGQKKACPTFTDPLHLAVTHGHTDPMMNSALCIAPRWNTHTNVHLWHVEVTEEAELEFEIENLQLPGFSWQINFRGGPIQQSLLTSCAPVVGGPEWLRVKVTPPAGSSNLINLQLRPYLFDGRESAPLPFVKLDGEPLEQRTSAAPITRPPPRVIFEAGRLAFNATLAARQKLHHKALQFHMYTMLALDGTVLSRGMVRSVYLPVGNPETQWLYGVVHEGFALHVKASATLLTEHLVFCSVYNRASLPTISSVTVDAPEYALPTCSCDGFFALRIVRKDGATTKETAKAEVAVSLKRVTAGKVE